MAGARLLQPMLLLMIAAMPTARCPASERRSRGETIGLVRFRP